MDLRRANIEDLPFKGRQFDHIFICFVLEHLTRPERAFRRLFEVLKPGGTVTVIEGDHGSTYFHPDSAAARAAIASRACCAGSLVTEIVHRPRPAAGVSTAGSRSKGSAIGRSYGW